MDIGQIRSVISQGTGVAVVIFKPDPIAEFERSTRNTDGIAEVESQGCTVKLPVDNAGQRRSAHQVVISVFKRGAVSGGSAAKGKVPVHIITDIIFIYKIGPFQMNGIPVGQAGGGAVQRNVTEAALVELTPVLSPNTLYAARRPLKLTWGFKLAFMFSRNLLV